MVQNCGRRRLSRPAAVGYGAGTADRDGWPNVLRVFLRESIPAAFGDTKAVVQIETNLDDLNPQAYETVMDRVFAAGALDVTLTPVIMKHGRPGIVLAALAPREKAEAVAGVVLRETTTLGVRLQEMSRRGPPPRPQSQRPRGGGGRGQGARTPEGGT